MMQNNMAVKNTKENLHRKNTKANSPLLKRGALKRYLKTNAVLYLMAFPGLLCLFLFKYVPMYGVLMAFQKYSPAKGILGSKWVGFEHFITFFESPYFARLIGNTFMIGLSALLFSFPAPIIFALLVNELRGKKFKRVTQTISYIPYFISLVVVIGILKEMLSTNGGIVNDIITALGFEAKDFFSDPKCFLPMYILTDIWSSIGYYSILYLAAIAGINPELYESAVLDGASRMKQIFHITLPCISSTIVIQLILSVGNMINSNYQKILLMQSPLNYSSSDVMLSYVYREGIMGGSYSYTTAINLFTSLIALVFLIGANTLAKKMGEETVF